MSDRKLTDGWPYITLDVCGVRLPFRQLGMPGARRKLLSDLAAAQAEGLDLLRAAQADDATDADRAGFERSQLLIEGSVGAYLMRLWVGPRMPTQDLVDADRTAEASALHFKGADHAEAAGFAFACDLCDAYGLTFEILSKCIGVITSQHPPGPGDPSAVDVEDTVRLFRNPKEGTT